MKFFHLDLNVGVAYRNEIYLHHLVEKRYIIFFGVLF